MTHKNYETPAAFRRALEDRLKATIEGAATLCPSS